MVVEYVYFTDFQLRIFFVGDPNLCWRTLFSETVKSLQSLCIKSGNYTILFLASRNWLVSSVTYFWDYLVWRLMGPINICIRYWILTLFRKLKSPSILWINEQSKNWQVRWYRFDIKKKEIPKTVRWSVVNNWLKVSFSCTIKESYLCMGRRII